MAESRLAKVGTVFSRIRGLIRGGAMKYEDRPLWYDVYEAFPPRLPPVHDRPAVMKDIPEIMYPEDIIRAKFYQTFKAPGVINLATPTGETVAQRFVNTYLGISKEQRLSPTELFEATVDRLASQGVVFNRQLQPPAGGKPDDHSLKSSAVTRPARTDVGDRTVKES